MEFTNNSLNSPYPKANPFMKKTRVQISCYCPFKYNAGPELNTLGRCTSVRGRPGFGEGYERKLNKLIP